MSSPKRPIVEIDNLIREHASAIDVQTLHQKGVRTIAYLTYSKVNELVAIAVARAFEEHADVVKADASEIERKVREQVFRQLDAYRRRKAARSGEQTPEVPRPEAERRKIELLERRIAKLRGHLERLENNLREIESGADSGLPSIYRTVQGLDDDDQEYETKKSLLKTVFEENLKLQCHHARSARTVE